MDKRTIVNLICRLVIQLFLTLKPGNSELLTGGEADNGSDNGFNVSHFFLTRKRFLINKRLAKQA